MRAGALSRGGTTMISRSFPGTSSTWILLTEFIAVGN